MNFKIYFGYSDGNRGFILLLVDVLIGVYLSDWVFRENLLFYDVC